MVGNLDGGATMILTNEELRDISAALYMRRNYIETGTVHLSAEDAINSKQSRLVRALDKFNKETIRRIEALAERADKLSAELIMHGAGLK